MPTYNKTDMMNCCRGWHDFSDGATECLVCGTAEDEASIPPSSPTSIYLDPTGEYRASGSIDAPRKTMKAALAAEAVDRNGVSTQPQASDPLATCKAFVAACGGNPPDWLREEHATAENAIAAAEGCSNG